MDDHQFKKEELETVGDLSTVLFQISLTCFELVRIGRPDILWSVNKLALAFTKWTRASDRLISYIHNTSNFRQYYHGGNTAEQCRLGFFHDSDFAGDLEDSKPTSGGMLCIFGSRTSVPISWMCKKQSSVSHSSTESEVISLDAGSPMDGIPALDFWDLVIELLHSSPSKSISTRKMRHCVHSGRPIPKDERKRSSSRLRTKANWLEVIRNMRQKYKVPNNSPCSFPVNEAIWRIFLNFCMWASVHLDKERDQFQRALGNMDVDVIQQTSTTTQNQIHSLQEGELFGLQVIGIRFHGGLELRYTTRSTNNLPQKCMSFADSVLCLDGKCQNIHDQRKFFEKKERIS